MIPRCAKHAGISLRPCVKEQGCNPSIRTGTGRSYPVQQRSKSLVEWRFFLCQEVPKLPVGINISLPGLGIAQEKALHRLETVRDIQPLSARHSLCEGGWATSWPCSMTANTTKTRMPMMKQSISTLYSWPLLIITPLVMKCRAESITLETTATVSTAKRMIPTASSVL